jgi:DNA-binding NarL/FixJ family response regulator
MLTTFNEDAYVIGALANGACGFLLKDIQIPALTEAIRDAAAGKTVLPLDVAATLASYLSRKKTEETIEPTGQFTALTGREYEAAVMLSQGFTNRQIASALYLTEGTVRNMVSAIYAKIGISDRAQAALYLKEHMR